MNIYQSSPYLFPKNQRLCSKKTIERVFQKGQTEYLYPFKIFYLSEQDDKQSKFSLPSVLFSIPKKNFKRAVDRNHIRRKLKEIYRLNKALIFTTNKRVPPSSIAIVYISKENLSYLILEEKLISIFNRLKGIQ